MAAVRRDFLGWDRSAVDLTVDWLRKEFPDGLSQVVVALPGARAGRLLMLKLREAYAKAGSLDWQPPQVVTVGGLTDEFVNLERPKAGRLVRTYAWEQALRGLAPGDIAALVARRPADSDQQTWRRLAGEVRRVFGELSAQGVDFHRVASEAVVGEHGSEQRRWQALAQAQDASERILREADLCDPQRGRREALERGDLRKPARQVVLVGVVEAIGLVRRLVEALDHVTALVFAPAEDEQAFDEMGCLRSAAWLQRSWAVPIQAWRIAEGPDDQARHVLDIVSGWKDEYTAEQLSIGIGDPEVTPFLARRFSENQVFARDAQGSELHRTPPAQVLTAVAALIDTGRFADFAALVRHPDVESLLAAEVDTGDCSFGQIVDIYHARHLPGPVPEVWPDDSKARDADVLRWAAPLGAAVDAWLAPLRGEKRPLSQWVEPVRAVLDAIYGARELDSTRSEDRLTREGLLGLAKAMASLQDLPAMTDPASSADQALTLLLAEAGAGHIPPRQPKAGEACVEMLGWLELAFDEAPALVVAGFNQGFIPEPILADGWLPDSLRAELGLPDDTQRLARDLFLLEWIMRSRPRVFLVSGRRTQAGEPLRPSRLAFRGRDSEILACARHYLIDRSSSKAPVASAAGRRELALPDGWKVPERWSATGFGLYLQSPYLFALKSLARLKTLDDRDKEMNPLVFGIVGHKILQDFAESKWADSTHAEDIRKFLELRLDRECDRRFGKATLPAVQLQRRQLAWRLGLFAEIQARRARDGWKIMHSEWNAPESVTLDVDGQPVRLVGQIDRIDYHEASGEWAILDYKFSETRKTPEKAHQRRGKWINIQLPLYAYLAREEVGETPVPQLGYFSLGASEADCRIDVAKKWDASTVAEALEVAKGVVRAVREQRKSDAPSFALDRPILYDPVLSDLCGERLLTEVGAEADE